jgi:hypothetical protein
MIYLYVAGALALIIGGLFIAVKIQSARADKFKAQAQAATETAKSAQKVIELNNKIVDAVDSAREKLGVEQKAAQVKIDAGIRDDFSGDSF